MPRADEHLGEGFQRIDGLGLTVGAWRRGAVTDGFQIIPRGKGPARAVEDDCPNFLWARGKVFEVGAKFYKERR